MRIAAIIAGLTILLALAALAFAGPGPEPIFINVVLAAALFSLALQWIAPQWSRRRTMLVSAAAVPALIWFGALGFDLSVVAYYRLFEPGASFMGGFSIVLFGPCLFAFLVGLPVAFAAVALGKRLRPR